MKKHREDRSRQMKERRKYHFGSILDGLLGVKSAVFSGDTLADDARVLVDKHRRRRRRRAETAAGEQVRIGGEFGGEIGDESRSLPSHFKLFFRVFEFKVVVVIDGAEQTV